MPLLTSAVERLLAEARNADSSDSIRDAAQTVMALVPSATVAERNAGVVTLSAALDPEHVQASGWLAITAGAIIETGADHLPLANRLLACLPHVMQRATEFGEVLRTGAWSLEASSEVEDDMVGGWVGEQFLPPAEMFAAASENLAGADAWAGLANWAAPAIACFTRDASVRKRAVVELSAATRLAQLSDKAYSLAVLVSVLDDEPFIVIHPASRLGYRLRVSGVSDNFQLHTLLADTLLGRPASGAVASLGLGASGIPGERPHPDIAAIARGTGPQQSDAVSVGVWDLYDWHALQSDGTLAPEVPEVHWIWGEGTPADIPRFDQERVVLLGPPSYSRTWNTCRYFKGLRADVEVVEALTGAQVDALLAQMGSANAGQ